MACLATCKFKVADSETSSSSITRAQAMEELQRIFHNLLAMTKELQERIECTIRCKRIAENLKSTCTPADLAFVAIVSQDFESFSVDFPKKKANDPYFYTAMGSFLSKMLTKFVPANVVMDEADTPEQRIKSIEYLASVDVYKEKNQRSLKSIDIGTKTKLFFLQGDVLEETKVKFRQQCLSFHVTAVTLLQENLPFTAPVIRDAQFLHPEKRNNPGSLTAVSKLTLVIADALQSPVEDILKSFIHN